MKTLLKRIGGHFRKKHMYYICSLITLGLLSMGIFRFPNAIGRLVESCRDFGTSMGYSFCELFNIDADISPTVNDYPDYSFLNVKDWFCDIFNKPTVGSGSPSTFLPAKWDNFKDGWNAYWKAFIDKDNFLLYCYYVIYVLYWVAVVVMFALPLWIGIKKLFNKYYFKESGHPETDEERADETRLVRESLFLRLWHKFYFGVIVRIVLWFVRFLDFVKEQDELLQLWLFLVLLYLNVFTIVIEFLAYYFYFAVSFDFVNLYRQLYKLILDLGAVLSVLPMVVWLIILYLVFDKISKYIAYEQEERVKREIVGYLTENKVEE